MGLSVKVGTFVQPASTGAQSITGVGFQPKLLLFILNDSSSTAFDGGFFHAFGAADGTHQFYISHAAQDNKTATSVSIRSQDVANCIGITSPSAATVVAVASFTSMDSDGFTINWGTADAGARRVSYIALGGSDINAFVGNSLLSAATGNQSITGVGFKPTLVMMANLGNPTAPPTVSAGVARLNFGFGTASAQEVSASGIGNNIAVGNANGSNYQRTSEPIAWLGSTTVTSEASLTSLDSDGFTINVTVSNTSYLFFVAISGPLNVAIGSFTQPSAIGNQVIGGLSFQPSVLFLESGGLASSTSVNTSGARFADGATDGLTTWSRWSGFNNGGSATVAKEYSSAGSVAAGTTLLRLATEPSTVNAETSLVSLNSNGFTLNWTTVDASSAEILYLALGGSAKPSGSGGSDFAGGGAVQIRNYGDFIA